MNSPLERCDNVESEKALREDTRINTSLQLAAPGEASSKNLLRPLNHGLDGGLARGAKHDVGKKRAKLRAEALILGGELAEEVEQGVERRLGVLFENGLDALHPRAGELGQNELLLGEVVEKRRAAHAGTLRNLIRGGCVEALAREEIESCARDIARSLRAAAVTQCDAAL